MDEFNLMNDEFISEEYQPKIDPTLSEIQECCKLLGINKSSDPDLEYIAIELLRAPLPEGWKFYRNKTNRSSYFFYNPSTKNIQTQHPSFQTFQDLYNSEKQKKTDSYNSNSFSDDIIDNDKLTQSQTQKINRFKQQQKQELNNLIAELDSSNSRKAKKKLSPHDKYQLSMQKYTDFSEENNYDSQIASIEKVHEKKLNELKRKNELEIREIKEKHERIKREAEEDLKRFQKSIEKKKEEENNFLYNNKKSKKKLKFYQSNPIYIPPTPPRIDLKRSNPISLDILDEDHSDSDNLSIQSKTEIPPFSINLNNKNFGNNNIIDSSDTTDTSSSEIPPFYSSPKARNNFMLKETTKIELQMGKVASNLKESLGSTYSSMTNEYNGIKDVIDKQSSDLNKQAIEYQQKTLEINKELNSALSEIHNMHRMALNTISSLQASLPPRFYYQPYQPTSLTPQPRRTHAIPGTFDSDDRYAKSKNSVRNKVKAKNTQENDFDHHTDKPKVKKRKQIDSADDYYNDDAFSNYDSDFSDFAENVDVEALTNTTGMKKLKKFKNVFMSAQKTQAKINIDFKRAKQQIYE